MYQWLPQRPHHCSERVGQVLLESGFITAPQLEQARQINDEEGTGLLDSMVSHGMLSQETLVTVLSFQLRIPGRPAAC